MSDTMPNTQSKFSPVVEKQSVPVIIQTPRQILCGNIHITPGTRIKDAMNRPGEDFIAVTDVQVIGMPKSRLKFLALQKEKIVWIAPVDENCNARSPFGSVIQKRALNAIIQTDQQTLRGMIYIPADFRLIDVLNRGDETFFAVSAAQIGEQPTIKKGFVLVNREHLLWIAPVEE